MTNYYDAKPADNGYKGYVYTWTQDGNRELTLWLSDETYRNITDAIEAAADWAAENEVEVELA